MYDNIFKFLENQKQHMMKLDEHEGLRERELSGKDFSLIDEETGKNYGMREMLYDNTLKAIRGGSNKVLFNEFMRLSQPGSISEDTLSTNIATFTTSLLPAVRRIFSSLIGLDLVSTQPLNAPSGYIYYLDHTYASTTAEVTAGDRLDLKRPSAYADSSEQATIKEVNFALTKKLVEVINMKLKADWTIEAEQDFASQWKMNLEAEIMPEVTNEIIRETDQKIIAALLAGVGAGNVNWNSTGYLAGDTTTTNRRDYRQTLYEAIVEANTLVFNKKYLNCDWLVMNGDTYTRLQKLENFNADPHATGQIAGIGRRFEGTLAGIYKVYVDPWFQANTILMGIRGDSWKYAVGYYAPYIPLFTSEKYITNDDFTQFARGAMSRFAYGVLPETSIGTTSNGLATITITTS